MVKRLAEYESLSANAVSSVDDIASAMSGEQPLLESHIAEQDGVPVGFTSFYTTFSTFRGKPKFYLEDIFVDPELRGVGIGKLLLAELAKLAISRGYYQLDWQVLDWNKPAIDFYLHHKAAKVESWLPYSMSEDAMNNLAGLS